MATLVLALADCLEALEEDSESLEACIAKYPDYREELDILLTLAVILRRGPAESEPGDSFLEDLRSRLMKEPTTDGARGGETV